MLHLLSFASWFLQLQFHWWQSNFRMLRGRTRWPTWRPPLPASLARPTSSEHLSTLNWWWGLYQSIWSIVKEYNIFVYHSKYKEEEDSSRWTLTTVTSHAIKEHIISPYFQSKNVKFPWTSYFPISFNTIRINTFLSI